jgi:plasmid maintenance system antidote protein VapI
MNTAPKEFSPDWLLVPGESVFDLIREKRWDLEEFSSRIGLSIQEVFALLKGKRKITSDLALSLSLVLGSTSDFWLALEANYQKRMVRKKASSIQASWQGWLKRMPVPKLQMRGVLGKDPDRHIKELLSFFAISSPGACELYYLDILKTGCIEIPEPIYFGSVAS